MRNINITINEDHSVDFESDFIGLEKENLQGNIVFSFKNFVNGNARAEVLVEDEKGYIILEKVGQTYTMPIKSSLLKGDLISMQLVIDEPSVNNEIPVWKSEAFVLKVGYSINATTTIPDEYPGWVEILNELKDEVEQAVEEANNLDLDMTNDDGVVTATITKKDGTTKEVEVIDTNDYYTKTEIDNKGYINKDVDDLTNYTKTNDLSEVALSGSYNDLSNTPNLSVYSLITETGAKIDLEINSTTYVLTAKLYDKNNNLLSTSTGIDLPLETMVVGARYDSATKEIVLTLKNGQEVRFSVADLVSGLVSETQLQQILLNYYTKSETDSLLNQKANVSDIPDLTDYVKNTDYASNTTGGVIKSGWYNLLMDTTGHPILQTRTYEQYLDDTERYFIGKGTLENVITGKELVNQTTLNNSQALQDNEISDLKSENDYLNSIINQLPKVSSQGTILTLNNTIQAKMNIELGTSELEQETTTGKNLLNINNIVGGYITVNSNDTLTLTASNGYNATNEGVTLHTICPTLVANQTYTLSFVTTETSVTYYNTIYLRGSGERWTNGTTHTITQVELDDRIALYGTNATISQLMISTSGGDYEPYTGGIPAPNPQYPMPIHTISGDNTIKAFGKNWFDKDNVKTNTWLNSSNVEQERTGAITGDYIKIDSSVSYTLSGLNSLTETNYYTLHQYDSNKQWIKGKEYSISTGNNLNRTFTPGTTANDIDSNCKYIKLSFYKYIGYMSDIQFEKGSTATTYEPYQSQNVLIPLGDIEYCEIGNYKDEFVRSDGSNLFDVATWVTKGNNSSYYSYSNGKLSINAVDGRTMETFTEQDRIYLPNGTYYLSNIGTAGIRIFNDDTNNNVSTNQFEVTLGYIYLKLVSSSVMTCQPMINKGTTAQPYQPYGIGNWGIRKNIGKVVLDGSETWSGINSNAVFFTNVNNAQTINASDTPQVLSNYYTPQIYNSMYNGSVDYGVGLHSSTPRILIRNKDCADTTALTTWLSTHNTIVYYQLATPTYTPITGQLATELEEIYQYLLSYKGQTSISQINNDLPFTISASALLDLNSLIGE